MTMGDTSTEAISTADNFVGGVADAGEGAIRLIRQINPFDSYNVTHPANYLGGLSDLAAGLVHTAVHPENLVTGLAHGWDTNPARALGQLTGNLALGFVGGRMAAVDRDAALTARRATEDARPPSRHPHPTPRHRRPNRRPRRPRRRRRTPHPRDRTPPPSNKPSVVSAKPNTISPASTPTIPDRSHTKPPLWRVRPPRPTFRREYSEPAIRRRRLDCRGLRQS